MPHVIVKLWSGKSEQQKAQLAGAILTLRLRCRLVWVRFGLNVGERECSGGRNGAFSGVEPAAKRRAAKLQTEAQRKLRFDQDVRDERDRNGAIRARSGGEGGPVNGERNGGGVGHGG